MGSLGATSGKEPVCQYRRPKRHGVIPGSGRSPGEWLGNPFHYSCLENPMDRGAWWATVHRVTKSWTQLKRLSMCSFLDTVWTHRRANVPGREISILKKGKPEGKDRNVGRKLTRVPCVRKNK